MHACLYGEAHPSLGFLMFSSTSWSAGIVVALVVKYADNILKVRKPHDHALNACSVVDMGGCARAREAFGHNSLFSLPPSRHGVCLPDPAFTGLCGFVFHRDVMHLGDAPLRLQTKYCLLLGRCSGTRLGESSKERGLMLHALAHPEAARLPGHCPAVMVPAPCGRLQGHTWKDDVTRSCAATCPTPLLRSMCAGQRIHGGLRAEPGAQTSPATTGPEDSPGRRRQHGID